MTTCCDTLSSHLFVYLLCFCIKESFPPPIVFAVYASGISQYMCLPYVRVLRVWMQNQLVNFRSFIYCASASRGVLSIVFAVYTTGIWQYMCLPYVWVLRVWMQNQLVHFRLFIHLFTVLLHQGEFYPLFLLFILLGYGSTRAFRTYGFSESGCRTSW